MNKHLREKGTRSLTKRRFWAGLTKNRAEILGRIIQSVVGAIIGIALTTLFCITILSVVAMALFGEPTQASQLLQTALTLAGSALGAVLGYFLGRARIGKDS